MKEGLRIKRSSAVFDFMAERKKKDSRTCVILDVPVSVSEGNELSLFFCGEMEKVADVTFSFGWDSGMGRIILTGAEDQVAKIMKAYYER